MKLPPKIRDSFELLAEPEDLLKLSIQPIRFRYQRLKTLLIIAVSLCLSGEKSGAGSPLLYQRPACLAPCRKTIPLRYQTWCLGVLVRLARLRQSIALTFRQNFNQPPRQLHLVPSSCGKASVSQISVVISS